MEAEATFTVQQVAAAAAMLYLCKLETLLAPPSTPAFKANQETKTDQLGSR